MFLTRKSLKKIRLLTGAYYILGVFCFLMSGVFALLGEISWFLVAFGIVCLLLGVVFRAVGRYAEGKGILLNSGNKLVLQQLRPAEFIRLYEEKRDSSENVIAKPDFDVLRLVATAYDALGDTEHELETLDEMLSIASEKKKSSAVLLKAAVLFSIGKIEEADRLFSQVQNTKMDLVTKMMSDMILKSDRAMAIGDYATAEIYFKQMLAKTFPKNTSLSLLYDHFGLAKIYKRTERFDEAKFHCNYCVENGGETSIQAEAVNMLNDL